VALDAALTSPTHGGQRSMGATTEERESTATLPLELLFYYPDPGDGEGPLCQREHLGELDGELCTGREAGCLLTPVRSA
jgi:hypothetical protein